LSSLKSSVTKNKQSLSRTEKKIVQISNFVKDIEKAQKLTCPPKTGSNIKLGSGRKIFRRRAGHIYNPSDVFHNAL